jgi:hypothetical protein
LGQREPGIGGRSRPCCFQVGQLNSLTVGHVQVVAKMEVEPAASPPKRETTAFRSQG